MTGSIRNCPVCNQGWAKILFHPRNSPGPVAVCQNCHMVYVEAIENAQALIFDGPVCYGQPTTDILTGSNLEDVKDLWELTYISDKEAEKPYLRQNALQALKKIEKYTGGCHAHQRLLDFGSGFGFFLAIAKEFGWETTYGLEPLAACSVYARAIFGLNITTDTLHEDTFPPEYFDVVTAFQVFEHIPYPVESLRHLSKSMKRNGILLIEVPRYDTWTVSLMRSRHRHFVQDHINFFSYKTLSLLLKNNGFSVIDYYHPKRIMSVQHLYSRWLSARLPRSVVPAGLKLLQRSGLSKKSVGINIGDIISVIGQKM